MLEEQNFYVFTLLARQEWQWVIQVERMTQAAWLAQVQQMEINTMPMYDNQVMVIYQKTGVCAFLALNQEIIPIIVKFWTLMSLKIDFVCLSVDIFEMLDKLRDFFPNQIVARIIERR